MFYKYPPKKNLNLKGNKNTNKKNHATRLVYKQAAVKRSNKNPANKAKREATSRRLA